MDPTVPGQPRPSSGGPSSNHFNAYGSNLAKRGYFVFLEGDTDVLMLHVKLKAVVPSIATNAAIWNPHRIHYDERYTTAVENHPGIVIDGPLQGDWLTQAVINWLGDDGQLIEFEYSNRRVSILGETLTSGGTVTSINSTAVTLDIFIRYESGDVGTPGSATVRITA